MVCFFFPKSHNKSFSILQSAVVITHLIPQRRCQSPEARNALAALLRRALRSLLKSWSAQGWAVRLRGDAVERRPETGGTDRNRLLFEKFICFSFCGWVDCWRGESFSTARQIFQQIPGFYQKEKRVLDAGEPLSGAPWMRCALSRGRRITASGRGGKQLKHLVSLFVAKEGRKCLHLPDSALDCSSSLADGLRGRWGAGREWDNSR